jgi:hypothetical protein
MATKKKPMATAMKIKSIMVVPRIAELETDVASAQR